ncbi:unnamed protein product [Moneuplotes crassus]|uniref:RING-CH-type domain-containing protein n=1 Tax=Euplotes crassus TaxID=5936 RepID=A0AAD1Y1H6_EUPCR|nr:unnamed protein product [Moneuplotes crassus]
MATTILELTTRRTIITQTLYGNPSETIHSIRVNICFCISSIHHHKKNALLILTLELKLKVHRLRLGTILKIGKFVFKVIDINTSLSEIPNPSSGGKINDDAGNIFEDYEGSDIDNVSDCSIPNIVKPESKNKQRRSHKCCRICLNKEDTPDNPLIEPCKCSGTMKSIHVECLREWLNSNKKVKKNGHHTIVIFTTTKCELCQYDFPMRMKKGQEIIELLSYYKPKAPNYFVLEALMPEEVFEDNIKVYHTFEFKEKTKISLGRKKETTCKISDLSVSKFQCNFHLIEDSKIFVEDTNSKYGTLVLMKKPIKIKIGDPPICVQVGRTYLKIECKTFSSCCSTLLKPSGIKIGTTSWMVLMADFPEEITKEFQKKRKFDLNKMTLSNRGIGQSNTSLDGYQYELTNKNLRDREQASL